MSRNNRNSRKVDRDELERMIMRGLEEKYKESIRSKLPDRREVSDDKWFRLLENLLMATVPAIACIGFNYWLSTLGSDSNSDSSIA